MFYFVPMDKPLTSDVFPSPVHLPAVVVVAGPAAEKRFIEFFTAQIRNPNTRQAYFHACTRFLDWLRGVNVDLETLEPVVVATYVEHLGQKVSAPTVKQNLAAIRMLFDWMVIGQVMRLNPTAGVREPRHVYQEGKTPVLKAGDARMLFDAIDGDRPIDYRDRALLGVMVFSFARVGAVVGMRVQDYARNGSSAWFSLNEKGGKYKRVPAHHLAAQYVEDYLAVAGIGEQKKMPLFRSAGRGRGGDLTDRGLSRHDVLAAVKRRTRHAGLSEQLGAHSFRGTGITIFLENGGDIETAAWIAGHASTRTTQLYDRRRQRISQGEIERIRF